MRFSIITVTLNSGNLLDRTVQSVDEQVCTDYEHIIKDRLSSDGSLLRVPISASRKIIHSNDLGIYDAMNQAIGHASGDYVIFLNAGDTFNNEDSLLRISNTLDGGLYDMIYCYINDNGAIITYPTKLSSWFMFRNALCHQSYFLKRELLNNCEGFDLRYKALADHDLMFKLILIKKISYGIVKEPLISIYPMGFTARNSKLKKRERKYLMKRYYSTNRYTVYKMLFTITLPSFRSWILKNTFLKKVYYLIRG